MFRWHQRLAQYNTCCAEAGWILPTHPQLMSNVSAIGGISTRESTDDRVGKNTDKPPFLPARHLFRSIISHVGVSSRASGGAGTAGAGDNLHADIAQGRRQQPVRAVSSQGHETAAGRGDFGGIPGGGPAGTGGGLQLRWKRAVNQNRLPIPCILDRNVAYNGASCPLICAFC